MATVSLPIQISPAYAGQTIGYKVLNLDRTEYSAYTITGVVDLGNGFFAVTDGVVVPDSGSYIQILENDETTLITETGTDPSAAIVAVPGQPAIVPGQSVSGVDFSMMRGDTSGFSVSGTGALLTDTHTVTAKALDNVNTWYETPDESAIFQVKDDGLHILNGTDVFATRLAEASLTVDDVADTITVLFEPTALADMVPCKYVFDVQRNRSGGITTVAWGIVEILADVTRTIS